MVQFFKLINTVFEDAPLCQHLRESFITFATWDQRWWALWAIHIFQNPQSSLYQTCPSVLPSQEMMKKSLTVERDPPAYSLGTLKSFHVLLCDLLCLIFIDIF